MPEEMALQSGKTRDVGERDILPLSAVLRGDKILSGEITTSKRGKLTPLLRSPRNIAPKRGMSHREIKQGLLTHLIGDVAEIILSYFDIELDLVGFWGQEGYFSRATRVALLPNNEVIVTDSDSHRAVILSAEGECLRQWGRKGTKKGRLRYPTGVALLPNNEVAIADTGNHRIQVFSLLPGREGRFLRQWGRRGSGPGEFLSPILVTCLPNNEVAVVDEDACRIQVFSLLPGREGQFLRQWGRRGKGEGEFTNIDALISHQGEIIVADSGWNQPRVQVFTPSGVYLRQWGQLMGAITHLSLTKQDEIAVADLADHRIQIFSPKGVLLKQWRHRESLALISDIIYLADDKIAIFDSNGPRVGVQVFHLSLH